VQNSADFDADFVKDENNDSGEWQAQMEYDMLRSKVRRLKEDYAKASGAAAREQEVYDKAYDKAIAAGHTAEEARAKAEAARKKHKDATAVETAAEAAAREARMKANGGHPGKVDESAVADAKEVVKKEEYQFKICTEELEAAKAALKKALEDADNAGKDNAGKAAAHQKEAQVEADKDEAAAQAIKAKEGEADAAESSATGEENILLEKQKDLQEKADALLKKVKLSKMSADEAKTYLDTLYKQLEIAEARLKYFRQHGGPPPAGWEMQFHIKSGDNKSGTTSTVASSFIISTVVALGVLVQV